MKISKLLAFLMVLFCIFALGYWIVQAKSDSSTLDLSGEEQKIQQTVTDYFEKRYVAMSTLRLDGAVGIIEKISKEEGMAFSELDKIEIELVNAEVNHLRFLKYEYSLDFDQISIDKTFTMAYVTIHEGHNVIFESTSPVISSMRNLKHNITLQKQDNSWIIVADIYNDDLWNMLNRTSKSKDEILGLIREERLPETDFSNQINSQICNLPSDNSSYVYDRYGAVSYAHYWAFRRNPNYYDFPAPYGDCTNFVSQSLHHGGGAAMEFGGYHSQGSPGWYYYSVSDYSASWTDVGSLHRFIVDEFAFSEKGPEGCDVAYSFAQVGDIIQFKWDSDEIWDHSVIIVQKVSGPNGPQYFVAAHSEDRDYYPLSGFLYEDIRFIHIDRIDGAVIHLPAILRGNLQIPEGSESYPAPMDSVFGEQIIEGDSSYPAP